MAKTAARYGVADIFDPAQNVRAGTQHLQELLALFGNDVELALAAYNAGVQAVERHGRKIPPYPETLQYVPRVLRAYSQRLAQ
jgi:soluble lytic murein transglycosylase-like protein